MHCIFNHYKSSITMYIICILHYSVMHCHSLRDFLGLSSVPADLRAEGEEEGEEEEMVERGIFLGGEVPSEL